MNTLQPPLAAILERLEGVKPNGNGFMALCPAHDDHEPSLSVARGEGGRVLLYCFAGCATDAILAALGMSYRDLFENADAVNTPDHGQHGSGNADGSRRSSRTRQNRAPIAGAIAAQAARFAEETTITYEYTDEAGALLYRVVRVDGPTGKRIHAERPDDNSGWIRNLDGVRRVLYRLPDVLRAVAAGQRIYITEGEKNADDVAALGLTATTNPHGAGAWITAGTDYGSALRGADVVILYDNDDPGRKHRDAVAAALHGVARSVRVVDLPGMAKGEDVSDWLTRGGTREGLEGLADSATTWRPNAGLLRSLRVVRAADVQPEKVAWLWPGYLAKGKIAIADGNPGDGKSTVALDLAARLSVGGAMPDRHQLERAANVVVMSAEDGVADTIVPRLIAAGADRERVCILTEIVEEKAIRPPELPRDIDRLRELIVAHNIELAIIDPLMAYLGSTIDAHRDQDVRRAMTPLKALAEETGAAILVIRHCSKAQGMSAVHKGGGSVGIIGAARIGWLFAPDPDAPPEVRRMVIAVTKSNLGAIPPALLYHTEHDEGSACGRVVWDGTSSYRADDLTGPAPDAAERGALAEAMEFLRDLLHGGPVPAQDAIKEATGIGIAQRTLERAKAALGVRSKPTGGANREWRWTLPDQDLHA